MPCGCDKVCYGNGSCKQVFDPSKPVQTRDGRKARIICTDRASSVGRCIVALVSIPESEDGGDCYESISFHFADGKHSSGEGHDLVNVKTKKWRWIRAPKSYDKRVYITPHMSEEEVSYFRENLLGRILETERTE